jgi:hypothetical protein
MRNFNIVDKLEGFEFEHYRGRILKKWELKNGNLLELKNEKGYGEKPKLKVVNKITDSKEINESILSLLEKIRENQGNNGSVDNLIDNKNLSLYTSYFTGNAGTTELKINTLHAKLDFKKKDRDYFESVLNNIEAVKVS